jgi:hypothetical protein
VFTERFYKEMLGQFQKILLYGAQAFPKVALDFF